MLRIAFVWEFTDRLKSLEADFNNPGGSLDVFRTRWISTLVSPAEPLATICSTLETPSGEMKTLVFGCSLAICPNKSNANPVLAAASFPRSTDESAANAGFKKHNQQVRRANPFVPRKDTNFIK